MWFTTDKTHTTWTVKNGLFLKILNDSKFRVTRPKWEKVQNWPMIKNPQFFSKHHETWSILPPCE